MDVAGVFADAFARIRGSAHAAVEGLSPEALVWRPGTDANPIGWLVWHLTRIQDDHVAGAGGFAQQWHEAGWAPRFGLPADADDLGYGHTTAQVAAIRPSDAGVLQAYLDAVTDRTHAYVRGLTGADLDRVVDETWDPPVTLGVRLVSVIDDDLQHVGQAAYVRGLWERRG